MMETVKGLTFVIVSCVVYAVLASQFLTGQYVLVIILGIMVGMIASFIAIVRWG